WADMIIGGYQISPLLSVQSGLPFSMRYSGVTNNLPGGSPSFPNQNGSFATGTTAYNPTAHNRTFFKPSTKTLSASETATTTKAYGPFSFPALDQVGSSKRNSFWGPGMWNADISLSKTVAIHESLQGQFRLDAFNA